MIKENLLNIFAQISQGNNLGEKISLVGATKTISVDVINFAIENGLDIVAENRVQEFREKTDFISKKAKQHFIGHLQTNKVKYIVGRVELIHSVDNENLAQTISKEAVKKNVVQQILCEINIGGELSKSGFSPIDAEQKILNIAQLENLKVVGLMAMLPHTDNQNLLKILCEKMRALYENLKNKGLPFEHLSMGMSSDFKIAIENGSNMIRIGSQIFGKREYDIKK